MAAKSDATNSRRFRRAVRKGSFSASMQREPTAPASREHLARVQDALRIPGALQRAHQIDLHGIGAGRELPGLQAPYAVLGADAAAEALNQIENRRLEHGAALEEFGLRRVRPLTDVEVQVPVAEMPVGDDLSLW